jgi:DNA-binding NtrC family response regulator
MPKLSGKDTFRLIKECQPALPVVICSGYLLNPDEFEAETGHRPTGFVQKPYNVGQLAAAVRSAIDGADPDVLFKLASPSESCA